MKFAPTVVGTMLRAAISHHGYTATEVARQVGMSQSFISRVQGGREKLPVRYVEDVQNLLPILETLDFKNKVMEQYY